MLGSYMEDLGINSEQFEKIFGGKGKKESNSELHTFLFEQVWHSNQEVYKIIELFKMILILKIIF